MPELPVPHDPSVDVPLVPVQGVTDERVQTLAAAGATFQQLIRDTLPAHPYVEQAVRYVDLAVQATLTAAAGSPPGAQRVAAGPPGPGRRGRPPETPSEPSPTGKQERHG